MDVLIQKIENVLQYEKRQAYFLCGIPGMGKTKAVLDYCSKYTEGLYLSFQHLDAAFAPVIFGNRYPEIFRNCKNWRSLFDALKVYAKEKRPTIFFDRVGNLKEQDLFYSELGQFLDTNEYANVMLIGRPWDRISLPYAAIEAEAMTMPRLADLYSLKDETAAEIISLTAGLPELLSPYDLEKSLEENIRAMLNKDSVFYRLAADWMNDCFRTPESYNTLLYGMMRGKNRINELSAFSGYPKNKCDKYIKALMEHGLVRRKDGKNGHSKYFPANRYLCLWYGALFTAVPNADGSFGEETYQAFMNYFHRVVFGDFYRELCRYWIKRNPNHNTHSYQYDNMHLVQRKSLFAEFKKDYNRIAHPRFVPSFVGRNH